MTVPEALVNAQTQRWTDLFADDRVNNDAHDEITAQSHRTAAEAKRKEEEDLKELPQADPSFLLDPKKCGRILEENAEVESKPN